NPRTGRIVLGFAGRIAGGGLVLALDAAAGAARVPAEPAEDLTERAHALTRALAPLPVIARLIRFRAAVAGQIVFTTSFGLEDQVLLHHLAESGIDADVVTLDTGRLFPETYATWEATERHFGRRIRAIHPRHDALEALVAARGVNGFYRSREARVACCDV